MRVRLDKRQRLLDEGVDPYPVGFPRTATVAEVRARYPDLEPDTYTGDRVGVTGRVMLSRSGGKLSFATIRDGTGDIQVMISLDRVGPDALAAWKRDVDLGDHIGVEGEVISSRRGELSVLADRYAITAKGLRPLPEKHRGLSDVESRDLHQRGFLEVETPVLQTVHGGANARPFVTRINAYNMELYLRIALELHLKRLIVGGIDKVYEIGRIFRNEGVDSTHNPEFTMLEAYEAYGDYDTVATLTRELIQNAAVAAYGAPVAHRDGREYDISGEWASKTVYGAISEALGDQIDPGTSEDRLRKLCAEAGVPLEPGWGHGQIVLEMYERLVEERTVEPTFYRDFPVDVSPLTRAHRLDPRLAERWDLVAFGTELGTGYSELVDPVEERRRLTAQSLLAAGGDQEAMQLDEDFLQALEYGMPPTGGVGVGIDRVLIMLTGESIRETTLFPLVRPQ